MNKRLWLIILPFYFLLAIFNSSSNKDTYVALQANNFIAVNGLCARPSLPNTLPASIFNKDTNNSDKNKVRIKAWEKHTAIQANPLLIPYKKCYNNIPVLFSHYSFCFQSSCLPGHSLRGPPVA
jgi:hypothetical protein